MMNLRAADRFLAFCWFVSNTTCTRSRPCPNYLITWTQRNCSQDSWACLISVCGFEDLLWLNGGGLPLFDLDFFFRLFSASMTPFKQSRKSSGIGSLPCVASWLILAVNSNMRFTSSLNRHGLQLCCPIYRMKMLVMPTAVPWLSIPCSSTIGSFLCSAMQWRRRTSKY